MPHPLLTEEFRQGIGELIDATVRDVVARELGSDTVLEAAGAAVDEALGLPTPVDERTAEARCDEAANEICEAVARIHADEIDGAYEELREALRDEYGRGWQLRPMIALSIDDVLADASAANESALLALRADLVRAFSGDQRSRKAAVRGLLAAERERVQRGAVDRLARARASALEAITLPDEALDAPLRTAPPVSSSRPTRLGPRGPR